MSICKTLDFLLPSDFTLFPYSLSKLQTGHVEILCLLLDTARTLRSTGGMFFSDDAILR